MSTWREPLCRVGLKPRYLSHMMGISRSTAAGWLLGIHEPHPMLAKNANILRSAALAALDQNLLPLNEPSMLPEERDVMTMRILRTLMFEVEESTT